MVETFTPAVCGSPRRQRVAAVLFGVSAVVTAGVLGAVLGLTGAALGAQRAVLLAAALALVAAAREAGLVRLPLPQSRRQVPEGWRFELPLPVWATGYGAGLGAGFLTYQPLATFWVACAGALALARPLPAALCFALYGAGRTLTLVWPRRRGADATEAVERIVARRPALVRANVAGLAACAALLALASTAEAARWVTSGLDPTVDRGVLAVAKQDGTVVVRGRVFKRASAPAIDGGHMAYVDPWGIRVVKWRTNTKIARIRGNVSRPSLDWPLIAFRRDTRRARTLFLKNLETGRSRRVARVSHRIDLGRPSLRAGRIAWHAVYKTGSRIRLMFLSSGRREVVARSRVALLRHPALNRWRILWTDERSGRAFLRDRRISGGRVRTRGRLRSRGTGYWTTALYRGNAYATRWSLGTQRASVYTWRR